MQKKALRFANCSNYNAHTDPIFFKHRILKLKDLYNMKCIIIVNQFLHQSLPNSLMSCFKISKSNKSTRTEDTAKIHLPQAKTDLLARMPAHNIPKLWNEYNTKWEDALKSSIKTLKFRYTPRLRK